MAATLYTVATSNAKLDFTTRNGSGSYAWWYDLSFDGKPLYNIGNLCSTCQAIFSLLNVLETPLAPAELSQHLRDGITTITPDILDTVGAMIPNGKYIVGLLNIQPVISDRNTSPNSLRNRIDNGRVNGSVGEILNEIVLPLIAEDRLDRATIDNYKARMQAGERPTVLALSVADDRAPSGRAPDYYLAHFLLDGHHKMVAARELGLPLSVLSFLSLDGSFAFPEMLQGVVTFRYDEHLILPPKPKPEPTPPPTPQPFWRRLFKG